MNDRDISTPDAYIERHLSRRITVDDGPLAGSYTMAIATCIRKHPDEPVSTIKVEPFVRECAGVVYHDRPLRFILRSRLEGWMMIEE